MPLKFHNPSAEEIYEALVVHYASKDRIVPLKVLKRLPCTVIGQRLGQDQYRCPKCSIVWDIDEERPDCQDQPTYTQREHP